MYITPVLNTVPGNGGIVPPWLQDTFVILPVPGPLPIKPPYNTEVVDMPKVVDPNTPTIM